MTAPLRKGYAAPPGTGPAHLSCGSCRHCQTSRVSGSGARQSQCLVAKKSNGGRFAGAILCATRACSEFKAKRGARR